MSSEKEEREATLFAMELLMPEQFVKDELKKEFGDIRPHLDDRRRIERLAKVFQVEPQVMAMRLFQLFERWAKAN
jgi:Zn-dependent peptidase ImmA (M78 family)